MAQFIGYVQGMRGEAHRTGSKKSGLVVRANGWSVGCRVVLTHNEETDKDEVRIYRTGGSNGRTQEAEIATFTD